MAESSSNPVGGDATASEASTSLCCRLCLAALFLVIGLAAGAVAFLGIGRYGASFRLPDEIERMMSQKTWTREEAIIIGAAERKQTYQNTALSVAILGGVAGGIFGLAAGLRRRAAVASCGGLIGGVLLGTAFGALGGLAELYIGNRLWSLRFAPADFERTFKTMAAHSAAFLIAGVGIGLAAGLAAKQVRHSMSVVLAAALIAGLLYPGLAAAMFPVPNTDAVVPRDFGPLLLWSVMPIALMGLALGRTKASPRPVRT